MALSEARGTTPADLSESVSVTAGVSMVKGSRMGRNGSVVIKILSISAILPAVDSAPSTAAKLINFINLNVNRVT
jgi:hypothetical protein